MHGWPIHIHAACFTVLCCVGFLCCAVQVDFGEDVCIFGEKFVVGLTEEIERVSSGGARHGADWDRQQAVWNCSFFTQHGKAGRHAVLACRNNTQWHT
jgi:hypothetical protein